MDRPLAALYRKGFGKGRGKAGKGKGQGGKGKGQGGNGNSGRDWPAGAKNDGKGAKNNRDKICNWCHLRGHVEKASVHEGRTTGGEDEGHKSG